MKSREAGIALALVLIVLAIVWWRTDGLSGPLTCGGRELTGAESAQCLTAFTTTAVALGGRYDSTDLPAAQPFLVPAGRNYVVTRLLVTPDALAPVTLSWGHGTTHVADSIAAPVNSRTMGEITIPAGGTEIVEISTVWIAPGGTYPWASQRGVAAWTGRVQIIGYVR